MTMMGIANNNESWFHYGYINNGDGDNKNIKGYDENILQDSCGMYHGGGFFWDDHWDISQIV